MLVNIESTIILEFENIDAIFCISLQKTLNWEVRLERIHKMGKLKIMYRYVSSCSEISAKHLMKKKILYEKMFQLDYIISEIVSPKNLNHGQRLD